MTIFEQMVLAMRKAQKEYYRTKTQTALLKAKELEKKVDDHLFRTETPDLPFGK